MGGSDRPRITPEVLRQCLPALINPSPVGEPGGSKRTFQAEWRGRTVAVQVFEQFGRERLDREIQALMRVESSHVPRLLDVTHIRHENRTLPVFICEFIEGHTLGEVIGSGSLFDAHALRTLARDVCMGLGAIHSCHLVHRDIKPFNIIVRSCDGSAVVVDLGVAKHLDRTPITVVEPGTWGWKAPEQIANQRVDRRADLFSLGLVLHYAAVGKHPFEPGDINDNILHAEPAIVMENSHGAGWCRLVAWLLCRQPYERPRSVDAVLRRLEELE